jgi:hypothetical protein
MIHGIFLYVRIAVVHSTYDYPTYIKFVDRVVTMSVFESAKFFDRPGKFRTRYVTYECVT